MNTADNTYFQKAVSVVLRNKPVRVKRELRQEKIRAMATEIMSAHRYGIEGSRAQ